MAELQLTQSLSIRPSHWSGPGNTDYSEPMPDEAEKMDEKFDEKPNLNLVYFAPGDPENPYNWSMVCCWNSLITSFSSMNADDYNPGTKNIYILHWNSHCIKFNIHLITAIRCNYFYSRGFWYLEFRCIVSDYLALPDRLCRRPNILCTSQ